MRQSNHCLCDPLSLACMLYLPMINKSIIHKKKHIITCDHSFLPRLRSPQFKSMIIFMTDSRLLLCPKLLRHLAPSSHTSRVTREQPLFSFDQDSFAHNNILSGLLICIAFCVPVLFRTEVIPPKIKYFWLQRDNFVFAIIKTFAS